MNKLSIRLLSTLLCFCVASSCITQQRFLLTEGVVVKTGDNSIEELSRSLLKVDSTIIKLKAKNLIFGKELYSNNFDQYVSKVLKECNSSLDTVVVASYDFIITKSCKNSQESEANTLYQFDFETSSWICSYVNTLMDKYPPEIDSYFFYRKLYITKRRNRVILKDFFGDIAVIYIIQGKDSKAKFYTTSVWDPSDFRSFITTANYIKDRIDPISYSIAKHKFMQKLRN